MKCPKCGGNGFVPTNVFGVNGAIKCDFCDGTGVFITNNEEPMTNEEWFDGLSTEEKATYITDIIDECLTWTYGIVMSEEVRKIQRNYIETWLKEKHDEM